MTKEDWLKILRLDYAWYLIEAYHNRNLNEVTPDVLDDYLNRMPDETLDDGRIEFFQKYFKKDVDEDELDFIAKRYADFMTDGHVNCEEEHWNLKLGFKAGYRKAMKENG